MAQDRVVMAFRKRLKKRGYRDISIRFKEPGVYWVSAIEPLCDMRVECVRSIVFMYHSFR